jgi:ADP-ribose pyrophosphatase YjhB (NUDIX family)
VVESAALSERLIRYCPYCGVPVDRRILFGADRAVCPQCGWIHFEDPKVAAGVLVEQDGKILLVQRNNEPSRGLWTFPAGFINAHEDPAEAAARECLEETGLQVLVTGLAALVSGREHPRGADFVLVYFARITGGQLIPGDDAEQAVFFPRNALPPLAFRATRVALGLE